MGAGGGERKISEIMIIDISPFSAWKELCYVTLYILHVSMSTDNQIFTL